MLVIISILIALLPAIAMVYPFLRNPAHRLYAEDESNDQADLSRRWEATLEGLKSAELERAIGNLGETDYGWLRQQYMAEAAALLQFIELEQEQEQELLGRIEADLLEVGIQARDRTPSPASAPEDKDA